MSICCIHATGTCCNRTTVGALGCNCYNAIVTSTTACQKFNPNLSISQTNHSNPKTHHTHRLEITMATVLRTFFILHSKISQLYIDFSVYFKKLSLNYNQGVKKFLRRKIYTLYRNLIHPATAVLSLLSLSL